MKPIDPSGYEPDPVFLNSRRETIVICVLFLVFMTWTVVVSYLLGNESRYLVPSNPTEIALVWGMPSWVFYGVVLPWLVVNVIAVWFCFGFMVDDPLDENERQDTEAALADGPIPERTAE